MVVYDASGAPVLVIGAAGGATIPVQVARGIIGVVDFGLPAKDALGLGLIMQFGDRAIVEAGSPVQAMIPQLTALGHANIVPASPALKANALHATRTGWIAARDPRLDGQLATTRELAAQAPGP
jgi:gamma-glutamyltranspeptidase/glutathione hydrolase